MNTLISSLLNVFRPRKETPQLNTAVEVPSVSIPIHTFLEENDNVYFCACAFETAR